MPPLPRDASTLDPGAVLAELGTDPVGGLTTREAQRRLAEVGPNELEATAPVPTWRKVLEQFRDPLVYLLFAAIVVSLVAWAVEGADGVPVDALVIAVIVVLNAVLGYVQQARAEDAVVRIEGALVLARSLGEPAIFGRTLKALPDDLLRQ